MSESHYRRAAALKCRTRFSRAIAPPKAVAGDSLQPLLMAA